MTDKKRLKVGERTFRLVSDCAGWQTWGRGEAQLERTPQGVWTYYDPRTAAQTPEGALFTALGIEIARIECDAEEQRKEALKLWGLHK